MDKKSKILIIAILILIAGAVGVTYWRIMVKKDYIISAQTDCDPISENCFVWNCDPAVDGEGVCTGNPEEDTWYYKIIKRKAANIPLCDPNDENCEALVCPEGEKDCEEIFCTKDSKSEEDICTTPEQYIIDHPEALEEEACDPETDENCILEEECDPILDGNCPAETEEAPADAGTSENAE